LPKASANDTCQEYVTRSKISILRDFIL
jgi:hypothetical protein